MKRRLFLAATGAATGLVLQRNIFARAVENFPPGWLPLNRLDDERPWAKSDDCIRLYLPPGDKPVRGIFVCFVFHSGDPRELARLWNFALITVPWAFEYDLGVNDKRNGRYQAGHPMQDMSLLLRYLEEAARETKRPELVKVPLVGWLGQNGSHLCANLLEHAPERILAWCDSFPDRLAKYPELTAKVPFALAWEFSKNEEAERRKLQAEQAGAVKDELTPPPDLKCRANTYGFPHGIYSKFNFFMAFLDRCIRLRLAEDGSVLPVSAAQGWAGDYNVVGEDNQIAPAAAARGMVSPIWLPDEYAAAMWRSYHSHAPQVKMMSPVIEYRKKDDKWGGPECGLGYGGEASVDDPLTFSLSAAGEFAKFDFYDGHQLLGTVEKASESLKEVRLDRGLHALYAVGVRADRTRSTSRPGFLIAR
jgi:hypothetical protein